jgi:hypothetical protein
MKLHFYFYEILCNRFKIYFLKGKKIKFSLWLNHYYNLCRIKISLHFGEGVNILLFKVAEFKRLFKINSGKFF